MNTIEVIREKLRLYDKKIITRILLEKILLKFGKNYSVSQISNLWLITPLKRGKYYFNNLWREIINPYIVWALYMDGSLYTYGWLWVYNLYGFTTQLADWQIIYNTKISGKKIIWKHKIIFKRQRESFFYGIDTVEADDNSYKIMSPERAFIERLKEWVSFTELPHKVDKTKLLKMSQKHTSKTIENKIHALCL